MVSEDGVFKFGKDRLRKIPKEESWINGNADNGIDEERQSQCELYYDRKSSLCLYVILRQGTSDHSTLTIIERLKVNSKKRTKTMAVYHEAREQ